MQNRPTRVERIGRMGNFGVAKRIANEGFHGQTQRRKGLLPPVKGLRFAAGGD